MSNPHPAQTERAVFIVWLLGLTENNASSGFMATVARDQRLEIKSPLSTLRKITRLGLFTYMKIEESI